MRKPILILSIIVAIIVFLAVAYGIFNYTVKKITEREVKRITQEETGKITQNEVDRITDEIIKQKTEEMTDQILGGEKLEGYECNLKPKQREFNKEPYYTGPLFDSHVHMPVSSKIVSTIAVQSGFLDMPAFDDGLTIDYIICLFDSEGIKKTIGFFLAPSPVMGRSVRMVKDIDKRHPDKIAAFYMPTPLPSVNPKPSEVEQILNENSGLFKGIGEVKFAFEEIPNAHPEDPEYLELYKIADSNNLVVMMHPASNHKEEVERILIKYPNAKFFLHGEIEEWVFDLMKTHKNLYYQIGHQIHTFGFTPEHLYRVITKEEWLAYFKPKFDSLLDAEIRKWKPIIEAHSDHLTLGTDRWYRWHFDYEVGGLMEEFERSFIGQLDPAVQEKFAYKNAERLIGESGGDE